MHWWIQRISTIINLVFVMVANVTYTLMSLQISPPPGTLCSKSITVPFVLLIIDKYWFNNLEYNGMVIQLWRVPNEFV
jgi:hypothetical protein